MLHDVMKMETISTLLTLCEGNPPVSGGLPSHKPAIWSSGVFFVVNLIRLKTSGRRIWDNFTSMWSQYSAKRSFLYEPIRSLAAFIEYRRRYISILLCDCLHRKNNKLYKTIHVAVFFCRYASSGHNGLILIANFIHYVWLYSDSNHGRDVVYPKNTRTVQAFLSYALCLRIYFGVISSVHGKHTINLVSVNHPWIRCKYAVPLLLTHWSYCSLAIILHLCRSKPIPIKGLG